MLEKVIYDPSVKCDPDYLPVNDSPVFAVDINSKKVR
jgi:hypothetical protein